MTQYIPTRYCPCCARPMPAPEPVKEKTRVLKNIGSAGDPRKLSLYELESGGLQWLPDADVVYILTVSG